LEEEIEELDEAVKTLAATDRYRTAAEALRGLRLYVERDRLPATDEREWYEADIVGLAAVGRDGRDWGKVIAFHDFGAGRTMEVSGGSASRSSVMLPFTAEAVPEIDVEGGTLFGGVLGDAGRDDFKIFAGTLGGSVAGGDDDDEIEAVGGHLNAYTSRENTAYYARAAAVVVPSVRAEPLSRVLIEASLLGKPVVATRAGGNPELIEQRKTGLLADPNPAALSAAILALSGSTRTISNRPPTTSLAPISLQPDRHPTREARTPVHSQPLP